MSYLTLGLLSLSLLSAPLLSLGASSQAKVIQSSRESQGSEPAYCDPGRFDEKEMDLGSYESQVASGLLRAHAFKLGKVTLLGLGVGDSKTSAIIELAKKYSDHMTQDKRYCTWYLNHPKGTSPQEDESRIKASQSFNFFDLKKNPMSMTEKEAVAEFMNVLEKTFDSNSTSFLSCATEQHYIALGCNGMRHRGPTVFGMLLAFSGCSPKNALEISNQIWGLNGVKRKVRLAVIEKAYELGASHRSSREKLAQLFSD